MAALLPSYLSLAIVWQLEASSREESTSVRDYKCTALYLSYKLDDPDEDVERGVSGHHTARALWEQSWHNAQETTRQQKKHSIHINTGRISDDSQYNSEMQHF